MGRREGRAQGLGERIVAFLRQRGAAAASHVLAGQFLNASVNSEELATRLLRPVLESLGARYIDGEGWVAGGISSQAAPASSPVFAAVVDEAVRRVCLVPAQGDGALEPLPPGTALPSDATLVMLEPRRDAGAARQWLRAVGSPESVSIRSLRSVVRGVVRVPRDADLSAICSALGVRWLDTEGPEGVAIAMAACVAEAAARRGADEAGETEQASSTAALPAGITNDMLAALPESPGVYRFHDADGRLLYVGKASNLKRRVSSYFTPTAARKPRRFQGRIHSMTHEVVASELEALLREARVIVRRAPPGNIQVRVHERNARYDSARVFALLLPDADARVVSVILVRDGRYLGHATIGPRGGGLAAARVLLGRAICPSPARPRRASAGADRDTAILRSWLARNGESASRLDLDGFTKADQAGEALAAAVKQLLAEPGAVVFR